MDKKAHLKTFFQDDGKAVILPIDHGTAIPVETMPETGELIRGVKPYVDGFVVNLGMAVSFRDDLRGKGVCLRVDVYKPDTAEGSYKIYGADEAEALGANAMMHMLYPGHPNETQVTRDCTEVIAEGLWGQIPTMIETLPVGLGKPSEYTVKKIGFAVRQAAELGADVVKTAYPTDGSVKEFRAIVESCFVPVIVLGGAPMEDDRALLTMVKNAMDAGAKGIAVGRNVWQHRNPKEIAHKLYVVVHEDADVEKALTIR